MRLQIGAEQTSVYAGDDRDAEPLAVLAIGTDRTAREFFRHDPPTPGEMENAIQAIEDAIMAARLQAPAGATLRLEHPIVGRIADLDGTESNENSSVGVDAVERVFGRLSSLVLGRPVAHDRIPADREFVATLTIVREFMHHLGFRSVSS